jgi:hypothetical protein
LTFAKGETGKRLHPDPGSPIEGEEWTSFDKLRMSGIGEYYE